MNVRVLVAQSCLTLRPHGLLPIRLFCPWNSPGKNIGAGCHFLLQGIFPTQGSNLVSPIAGGFITVWATREVQQLLKWPSKGCSKELNSPMAFMEGFLKATFEVRAAGSMTLFWLVDEEETGWCLGSLNHQLSGSNQSGVYMWWASSHHLPPGMGEGQGEAGVSFCITTQRSVSDCYADPLRRN